MANKTDLWKVQRLSLIAVIVSTSGWLVLVFNEVTPLFGLQDLNLITFTLIGLIASYLTYFRKSR